VTRHAARLPAGERRAQLLDATRCVVARGGYVTLTMEAVAREANVTKPVVYSAFANRDDAMTRLLEVEGARVVAEIGAAIELTRGESPDDLGEMVSRGLERVLDIVRAQPQRYRLILIGVHGAPRQVREAVDEGRRILTAQVAAEVGRAPAFADADTELLATMLVAVAEHAATLVLTEPERFAPARFRAAMQALLSAGS
jgi:AcrR family transcriptional regulator